MFLIFKSYDFYQTITLCGTNRPYNGFERIKRKV